MILVEKNPYSNIKLPVAYQQRLFNILLDDECVVFYLVYRLLLRC
jgi:hypothetical protein